MTKRHAILTLIAGTVVNFSSAAFGITILAGDIDNFASFDAITDTPTLRTGFAEAVQNEPNNFSLHDQVPQPFDSLDRNRTFGHTFQDLCAADLNFPVTLELGMRTTGGFNDTLHLMYTGTPPTSGPTALSGSDFSWGARIQSLTTEDWGAVTAEVITLDLTNLPGSGLNIVPQINANGYLDVYSQDDTGFDYISLDYQCVPEPSGMSISCLALMLLPIARRWAAKMV